MNRKRKLYYYIFFLCLVLSPLRVYADVDPMASAGNTFIISEDLIRTGIAAVVLILGYFFSYQLQSLFANIGKKFITKLGIFSTSKEYYLQRYVYQHDKSPITKLYIWVNSQIVALGLKRNGVTVVGYLIFWGMAAIALGSVVGFILRFGVVFTMSLWVICFVVELIMTRVTVSEKIEKRESDVMNAIDLIVPEVSNGIKNAIVMYQDNFAPSIQEDFKAFVANIQDRGYTFEDAMYILTDNLGLVFRDFAQKAIYYEAIGEKEMEEIFTDITETNRLRRQLREENNAAFAVLKGTFITSALITFGYFLFIIITDAFSRHFFLETNAGRVLLIIILMVIFCVLAYISTIKSRVI